MSRDCEICRGARIVRLPVYRRAEAAPFDETVPAIEQPWREYPCPECGDSVGMERVAVLDAHTMVDDRPYGPEFDQSLRHAAARRLVDHLLDGGYITFERGATDLRRQRYPVVATIGVVTKGAVASLEQRIAKRQGEVAAAAADEAIYQINNWGSASRFIDHRIGKDHAARFIREAVKEVSEKWSKARAIAMKEPA